MSKSYLDLPYDLTGFLKAIEKFFKRDDMKNAHKIVFELPLQYKKIVKDFVRLQENPDIEENIGDNDIYKFTCLIENKPVTFLISSKTKELNIKVFKPEDKNNKN